MADEGDDLVVINEVLFDAVGEDAGREWIELYNRGSEAADVTGWRLNNHQETIATLPEVKIPANGFLLVRLGDASAAPAEGVLEIVISRNTEALGNDYGEVALYRGPPAVETIVDFVAYTRDGHRDEGPGYQHAVAAKIWLPRTAAMHAAFVEPGSSLGRDSAGEDTDTGDDWWRRGGLDALAPTPGAQNTHPLAYELCALRQRLPLALLYDVTAAHQARIDMLKRVLQQIRTKHMDLLNGLGDSLIGDGEPVQEENGDLVVGKIRFRFGANLKHPVHKDKSVGGLTYPPEEVGGEILILLNATSLAEEWRMKDAVLHEIGHAAQFQDARAGYFKPSGREESNTTRGRALPTHECRCYLSNMRLLCRFKLTGEFSEHAHDIDARLQFKADHFMSYLKQAAEGLQQFAKNRADWAYFGAHLLAGLNGDRDLALKVLAIAIKLPTEEERKAGESGKVTDHEKNLLKYIIRLWNSTSLPGDQIPESGLERFVNDLLGRDIDELIKEVGAPPAPAGRAPQPPPEVQPPAEDDAARAAAAAEAARVQAIRDEEERLKQEYYRLERQRKAALAEVTKYEEFKRIVDRADPNAQNGGTVEVHKRLEEAKRALAIATALAREAMAKLAAYRRAHREELAYVPPGDDRRLARATVLTNPGAMLITDMGQQAYANYERVLDSGDSGQLNALAETFVLDDIGTTDSEFLVATDLQMMSTLNDATIAAVADLKDYLADTKGTIRSANGDPEMLAATIVSLRDEPTPIDNSIASYLDSPEAFRLRIYNAFSADIMRQLAREDASTPGASVTKGNAVVDAPSGTSVVGATVKISLFADEPADEPGQVAEPDVRVAKTDEQGQFNIQGRGIATVTISGDDLVTQKREVRLADAPFGLPKEEWEAMSPEEQEAVLRGQTLFLWHVMDGFFNSTAAGASVEERSELTEQLLRNHIDYWNSVERYGTARQDYVSDELIGKVTAESMTRLEEAAKERRLESSVLLREDVYNSMLEDQYFMRDDSTPDRLSTNTLPESIGMELDGAVSDDAWNTFRDQILEEAKRESGKEGEAWDALREQLLQSVDDRRWETLRDQLLELAQSVAPDAENIRVELRDGQTLQFPVAAGGHSIAQNWAIYATGPDGAPLAIDQQRLQTALDEFAASNPMVRFAESGRPREAEGDVSRPPKDPSYSSRGTWGEEYFDQWALRRIGVAPQEEGEWPQSFTEVNDAQPAIVAIIGSGIDWTHPELFGQVWLNPNEDPYNGIDDDGNGYIDDQFGFNFRDESGDVIDEGGHETHVAGVIAARWNDRGIAGVNPYARVMALKVANYLGKADSIDISRAIYYAVNHGARVINISYSGEAMTRVEQRAVEYANAKGVLVVVAAGNQASDAQQRSPAAVSHALTVAGLTIDDQRAPFSNWGQPVDIAAPAMDVLGLRARDTDFLMYVGENPEYTAGTGVVGEQRDLYRASGTSFAAPFVSGAASLLFSVRPELTAEQVKNMLLMSASDVDVPGWDQNSGVGLLNLQRALTTDPDRFLLTRISRVAPKRRNGMVEIEVHGIATGTKLTGRWLQIAFGKEPQRDAWTTIQHDRNPVDDEAVLGAIPASRFNRRGTWSIRILVQDDKKNVRQARAVLNLE